jgi:hypothetical protein
MRSPLRPRAPPRPSRTTKVSSPRVALRKCPQLISHIRHLRSDSVLRTATGYSVFILFTVQSLVKSKYLWGAERLWDEFPPRTSVFPATPLLHNLVHNHHHLLNKNSINIPSVSIYVPPNLKHINLALGPHSPLYLCVPCEVRTVSVCSVRFSQQTATVSPHSINWLGFVVET